MRVLLICKKKDSVFWVYLSQVAVLLSMLYINNWNKWLLENLILGYQCKLIHLHDISTIYKSKCYIAKYCKSNIIDNEKYKQKLFQDLQKQLRFSKNLIIFWLYYFKSHSQSIYYLQ